MKHSFDAAIFDMDGVLIDTVLLHWKAYNELLMEWYGVSMPTDELYQIVGMSLAEQIPILNEKLSITIDADAFILEANGRKERAMSALAPKPGVAELLRILRAEGIRLGVGTSTSEEVARQRLESIAIEDYFDTIVGEERVKLHKPDPEVYLTVAKQLGVAPRRCVVFEDAPSGLSAAIGAGMKTVAIQSSYVPRPMLAKANSIIETLEDITVKRIDALFAEDSS